MTDSNPLDIPAAIARVREALDDDDMLAVANRSDFAALLEEYDRLCAVIRHTHATYCDGPSPWWRHAPECLLYELP